MGSSSTKRMVAALCLCLAGAALSVLLLGQHHGEPWAVSSVSQACGEGAGSGCEEVARSSWSAFAGIPVAAWGLVFYLALAFLLGLALLGPADLRDPLAGAVAVALALALLVDLLLLGVQALAIHAFCKLCIATYVLGALALAALFPALRSAGAVTGAVARPEGRLALGAWLLVALALVAAVLAGDRTLAYRAAQRQATLLGAPLPAAAAAATPATTTATPTPAEAATPAPSPSGPQDLRYWQQRAEKLQATIDDPRKLEEYYSEKAQHEYDTATPVSLDVASAALRGPASAPVKVVEYSDFLCPFCRNLALGLSQFMAAPQLGGRVALYFKNYPLDADCNPKIKQSVHPGACNLALGAVCAQAQGRFDAYHDKVFSTELHNPQAADVARLAGEAGLNAAALQGCLDDPKTKETLAAQIAEANRLGVSATPTLYINGKKLPRVNDFVAVVDKEARKKGFPPMGK